MWKRMAGRLAVYVLVVLIGAWGINYLWFGSVELPAPKINALQSYIGAQAWEESETTVRRHNAGYAVTLTHRYPDGRITNRSFVVHHDLRVQEIGVSLTYPHPNAVNLILALACGALLFGYAVFHYVKQRRD